MIDEVFQVLKTIINKELRGNLTPSEFNLVAKQVQDSIFRGYFEDANRDKNKENRGQVNQNYANLSFIQRQRIDEFSFTAGLALTAPTDPPPAYSIFTLPADLYLIKHRGISSGNNIIDEAQGSHLLSMISSSVAPSSTFPVYERQGNLLRVYPNTILVADCRYLRNPLDPKWTFTVVSNSELFNIAAGDFQDFELNTSEFSRIVIEMLSYFGINIREPEVAKYAEALKRITEVKEEA